MYKSSQVFRLKLSIDTSAAFLQLKGKNKAEAERGMAAAGFHRVSRLGGHTQQHLDCRDTRRCAYIFRGDPQKEHFASKEPKQTAVTHSPLQFNPGGWLLVAGGMGRSRIQTLVV